MKQKIKYEQLANDLVNWMRKIVFDANCKGIVYGLSGGLDSSVIAALAKKAFGNESLAIIMPCHSIDKDKIDALKVINALDIPFTEVDLTTVYDEMVKNIKDYNNNLAYSNIKPRLRMTTLYYYAQSLGYLVCGSSNLSEYYIGYFTKHGDSGVDLLPLINIPKSYLYGFAKYLQIPDDIINKKPSAGLWEGQSDEDEIGFTYDEIDEYILNKNGDENLKDRISNMHNNTAHKRVLPPAFDKYFD
ncbi:MAG: NAD(+) synthase [Tissierellia bacterium]|nr:NAD(+) synthase [Tissierellia bacterium]